MPKTLNPVPQYVAPLSVPEPGDPRTALSVEGPFQVLADRAAYLRDYLMPLTQHQPLFLQPNATFDGAALTPTAASTNLYLPLFGLLQGATLTQLTIDLSGGHPSPATPVHIELFRTDASGSTSLASANDTSPGTTPRSVTLTPAAVLAPSSFRYLLRYTAESESTVSSIVAFRLTLTRPA